MLYPILFILLVNYYTDLKQDDNFFRVFWRIFFILSGLALLFLTWYFLSQSASESKKALIYYCITLLIAFSAYFFMWKKKDIRLELIIILLLFGRIFFNLVALPDRLAKAPELEEIKAAGQICKTTRLSELKLDPAAPVSIKFVYYMSTSRGEILRKEYGEFQQGTYYIFDARNPLREGEIKIMEFESSWKNRLLRLSTFTDDQRSSTSDNDP